MSPRKIAARESDYLPERRDATVIRTTGQFTTNIGNLNNLPPMFTILITIQNEFTECVEFEFHRGEFSTE